MSSPDLDLFLRIRTNSASAEQDIRRFSNSISNLGQIAAAALGGLSFAKMTDEIGSFESAMITVRALTSATADEMAKLSAQARELGASTAFSAQQTAEAQGVLASAGLKTNEILSATPDILDLAAAGAVKLSDAAEIATGVLSGMGLALGDLPHINDVLVKTAADTKTSVQDLGAALQPSASIAKTFGISLEQLSASMGILAQNNIKGSEAGNNFKALLVSLGNETKDGTAILAAHGLAYADLNVQALGLIPVLENLRNANLSGAEALKLFGSDAGNAGLILSGSATQVQELSAALREADGAAAAMAAILNTGLKKELDALYGAVSESILQLGDAGLKGALSDIITTATGVISVYSGMIDQFAESNKLTKESKERLEGVAGGLRSVVVFAGGVGVLNGAIWATTAAVTALNFALRLNPFVLAGSAIAGIGALAYDQARGVKARAAEVAATNLASQQKNSADAAKGASSAFNAILPNIAAVGNQYKQTTLLTQDYTAANKATVSQIMSMGNAHKATVPHIIGAAAALNHVATTAKAATAHAGGHATATHALGGAHKAAATHAGNHAAATHGLSAAHNKATGTTNIMTEAMKRQDEQWQALIASANALDALKDNTADVEATLEMAQQLKLAGLTGDQIARQIQLQDEFNKAIKANPDLDAGQVKALTSQRIFAQKQLDEITKAGSKDSSDFANEVWIQSARNIQTSLANAIASGFEEGGKNAIPNLANEIKKSFGQAVANEISASILSGIKGSSGQGGLISSLIDMIGGGKGGLSSLIGSSGSSPFNGTGPLASFAGQGSTASGLLGGLGAVGSGISAAVPYVGMAVAAAGVIGSLFMKEFRMEDWTRNDTKTTGSVLGDSKKASESINNLYSLSKDLGFKNYLVLKNIDDGIKDVRDGIIQAITGSLGRGELNAPNVPAAKPGFLGLFSSKSNLTQNSIKGQGDELGKLMDGAILKLSQFTQIVTTSSGFLGIGSSSKPHNTLTDLSAETNAEVTKIFTNIGSTLIASGETLGLNVAEQVRGIRIPDLQINIKDLSGEEATKVFNAAISTMADGIAKSIFPFFQQFQKVGEGMLETVVRVTADSVFFTSQMSKLGVSINLSSQETIAYSQALAKQAGGTKEMQSNFEAFFTSFYTEAQQFAANSTFLTGSLESIGLFLPRTQAGYKDLVTIELSLGETHVKTANRLLELAPAAAEYYKVLEAGLKIQQSVTAELIGLAGFDITAQLIKIRADVKSIGEDAAGKGAPIDTVLLESERTKAYTKSLTDVLDKSFADISSTAVTAPLKEYLDNTKRANDLANNGLITWAEALQYSEKAVDVFVYKVGLAFKSVNDQFNNIGKTELSKTLVGFNAEKEAMDKMALELLNSVGGIDGASAKDRAAYDRQLYVDQAVYADKARAAVKGLVDSFNDIGKTDYQKQISTINTTLVNTLTDAATIAEILGVSIGVVISGANAIAQSQKESAGKAAFGSLGIDYNNIGKSGFERSSSEIDTWFNDNMKNIADIAEYYGITTEQATAGLEALRGSKKGDLQLAIEDFLKPFKDSNATKGMNDYQKAVYNIDQGYKDSLKAAKDKGITDTSSIDTKYSSDIAQAAIDANKALTDFIKPFKDTAAMQGMNDYQKSIYTLDAAFNTAMESAIKIGATEEELAAIRLGHSIDTKKINDDKNNAISSQHADILAAQGEAEGALKIKRDLALAAIPDYLRAGQVELNLLEDKKTALDKLNTSRGLDAQIMTLQGNATGALALNREIELSTLDPLLKGQKLHIYQLEDEAAALEKRNAINAIINKTNTDFSRLNVNGLEADLNSISDSFISSITEMVAKGATLEQAVAVANVAIKTGMNAYDLAVKEAKTSFDSIFKTLADKRIGIDDLLAAGRDQDKIDAIQRARAITAINSGVYDDQIAAVDTLQNLITKRYDDEIAAVEKVKDSIAGINKYLSDLKLNDKLSLNNPKAIVDESKAQFATQLALAKAGDQDALASITTYADKYLNSSRDFNGVSQDYLGIYKSVTESLGGLGASSAGTPEQQIAKATQKAASELQQLNGAITTITQQQTKALSTKLNELAAITQTAGEQFLDSLYRLGAKSGIGKEDVLAALLKEMNKNLLALPAAIAGLQTHLVNDIAQMVMKIDISDNMPQSIKDLAKTTGGAFIFSVNAVAASTLKDPIKALAFGTLDSLVKGLLFETSAKLDPATTQMGLNAAGVLNKSVLFYVQSSLSDESKALGLNATSTLGRYASYVITSTVDSNIKNLGLNVLGAADHYAQMIITSSLDTTAKNLKLAEADAFVKSAWLSLTTTGSLTPDQQRILNTVDGGQVTSNLVQTVTVSGTPQAVNIAEKAVTNTSSTLAISSMLTLDDVLNNSILSYSKYDVAAVYGDIARNTGNTAASMSVAGSYLQSMAESLSSVLTVRSETRGSQVLATFAKGGVTNKASIFGEAGWEAAVPLPDGRNIPVTINSLPVQQSTFTKTDNKDVIEADKKNSEAVIKAIREAIAANAVGQKELVLELQEAKAELARLRRKVEEQNNS